MLQKINLLHFLTMEDNRAISHNKKKRKIFLRETSIKMTREQQNIFWSNTMKRPETDPYFYDLANQLIPMPVCDSPNGESKISAPISIPFEGWHFLSLYGEYLFLESNDSFHNKQQLPQKKKSIKYSKERAEKLLSKMFKNKDTEADFEEFLTLLLPVDIPKKIRNVYAVQSVIIPPYNRPYTTIFFDDQVILVAKDYHECSRIIKERTSIVLGNPLYS